MYSETNIIFIAQTLFFSSSFGIYRTIFFSDFFFFVKIAKKRNRWALIVATVAMM